MGRAFGAGVLFVACLLMAAPGRAQVPAQVPAQITAQVPAPPPAAPPATQPVTGFVSSYEITRIARSAGFDPLAPPLREGTIYVLRATDYRGILMRVVIDAHTGAIRDANRIVPGPGRYGQFYGAASLYDPADLAEPAMVPSPADMEPPPLRPLLPHSATRTALPEIPPLPRPRPAALASRKPLDDGNPAAKARPISDPKSVTTPAAAPDAKAQIDSQVITAAPSVAPAAPAGPKKSPALVEPLND
ncbi:MAG TPA: hypothetical protein VK337_11295 [Xanthobacteraceae bacterium]|nr:hypothetical protein [Xanthobacteraceae bacterium]